MIPTASFFLLYFMVGMFLVQHLTNDPQRMQMLFKIQDIPEKDHNIVLFVFRMILVFGWPFVLIVNMGEKK